MPASKDLADIVEVGYVARAHGVKGWIRIHCHDRDSFSLATCPQILLGTEMVSVLSRRKVEGAFLLQVDGVSTREEAEKSRGLAVGVERSYLALAEDDVLLTDFVGCAVFDQAGEQLGVVAEVIVGVQHRLVVRGNGLEREIPLVDELVPTVELSEKRLSVDLPEGFPVEVLAGP